MDMEKRHRKPGYIVLIVLTLVFLVVTIIFSFLPSLGDDTGLYSSSIDELADRYSLLINPADWTFSIWGFIFTAQVLWVIYAHTLICRNNKYNTGALYYDPPFLPPSFFVVYMMALILTVTWTFAFDSEFLSASFTALAGLTIALYVCLCFSFKYLWDYENALTKGEMWANIILVQNGIGMYATWTTIATLLNFGIVLHYDAGVTMETSCYVVLVLLLAEFLLFAVCDIFVLTTRLRYFYVPYIVLIVALAGSIDNNWDADNVSGLMIFVVVILAIVLAVLILKIVATIYNSRRKPLSIEQ